MGEQFTDPESLRAMEADAGVNCLVMKFKVFLRYREYLVVPDRKLKHPKAHRTRG